MLDASARQGLLKPIRLVLVDRQPIVLQGLKSILGAQQDFDVVASSGDGKSCLAAIRNLLPDVALVADSLPDLTASDILAIVKAENLATRLVFFTDPDIAHDLSAAIAAGACSVISKYADPATMLRSLRLMAKSGVSLERSDLLPTGKEADGGGKIEKMLELLTPRERQIVRLVSEGMSNKEIARRLDVSQGTVKVHLHNIFQKLEITNRTVLATISWLQRTSGFGALALAFLAFAIADELKASEANDAIAHDEGPGRPDEHAGYEVWKKAILQHVVLSKSDGPFPLTERDLLAKASQAVNPAVALEALRAAEQFMGSAQQKDGRPVGSSTSDLPPHLLRAISDTESGSGTALEHQVARLASSSMSLHGGYGTFAALAGALICALHDPQLAQAKESGQVTIDSLLSSIGDDATSKLAAITHVDATHAENPAPEFLSHDFGGPSVFVATANDAKLATAEGMKGPDAAAVGLQPAGLLDLGHDFSKSADSRDQQTGGSVEGLVDRFPTDANASSSDTVVDVESGPDRINLAAFGALALLQLTAAIKSIPPHTLAWFYNAETNETIVYVNPTDRILDVGDRGLLEFHLQGIVSVAELDVVHHPEGVAVAATLEQLEALIPAIATEETVLGADGIHTDEGESSLGEGSVGTSGIWGALAHDGWSFQFAQGRTGLGTPAKFNSFTNGSADRSNTGGERADGSGAPLYVSSNAPNGRSEPTPAAEKPTPKSEPMKTDTGAPTTQQNEMVPPGLARPDDTGRGNSHDVSGPGSAKAADESTKPGNDPGKGAGHHAPASEAAPASAAEKKTEQAAVEHGNADHERDPSSAKAPDAEIAGSAGGGRSHHGSEHGSAPAANKEMAEAKSAPDHDAGHDNEHHSPASDGSRGSAKAAEKGGLDHGKAGHPASASPPEAEASVVTAEGAAGHHPDHAATKGSAKAANKEMAEAKSAPDHDAGHDNEHHSPASDGSRGSAKAEKGGVEHGKAGHPASASPPEAEASIVAAEGVGGHHPDHAANKGSKAANKEMAEAKSAPDHDAGHDNEHHSPASDGSRGSAKAEKGGVEHGKAGHPASASPPEAEASIVAAEGVGGHHPDHAANKGSKAANKEMAEAKSASHHDVGHGNEHHSSASDRPRGAAETSDKGGDGHGEAGHPASASVPKAEPSVTAQSADGVPAHQGSEPGSAKAAAKEMATAKSIPDNGVGHDDEHSSPASDGSPGAAKTTDKGSSEHGNAGHLASASPPEAEPSIVTAQGADGDHGHHGSKPGSAKAAANEMTAAKSIADNGGGGAEAGGANGKHAVQSDASPEAPQPPKAAFGKGSADQELVFRFDHEAAPATLVAKAEAKKHLDAHVEPGRTDNFVMFAEMVQHAPDHHAAEHGNHAPHHGILPAPHDLLI